MGKIQKSIIAVGFAGIMAGYALSFVAPLDKVGLGLESRVSDKASFEKVKIEGIVDSVFVLYLSPQVERGRIFMVNYGSRRSEVVFLYGNLNQPDIVEIFKNSREIVRGDTIEVAGISSGNYIFAASVDKKYR